MRVLYSEHCKEEFLSDSQCTGMSAYTVICMI